MISLEPDSLTILILACCSLHNFLMKRSISVYVPSGSIDTEVNGNIQEGFWRNEGSSSKLESLPKTKQRFPKNAEEMGDIICQWSRCNFLAMESYFSMNYSTICTVENRLHWPN